MSKTMKRKSIETEEETMCMDVEYQVDFTIELKYEPMKCWKHFMTRARKAPLKVCPIILRPMMMCQEGECPHQQMMGWKYETEVTPVPCPDCSQPGGNPKLCDRCYGSGTVALEDSFLCDTCGHWCNDECEIPRLKNVRRKDDRPRYACAYYYFEGPRKWEK